MVHYFIQIAKQQSLSKAAAKLFISQPALSKQIKKMESMVGYPLFRRNSKGIELTSKGRALYEDLAPHFQQIHQKIEEHIDHDTIRFGCTPFVSSYYLLEHYQGLNSANVKVTMIKNDSAQLLPHLEEYELDAVIVQDMPSHPRLYTQFLFEDEFVAAVPSNHPLAQQELVSIEECLVETMILPPPASPLYKRVMDLIEKHNVIPLESINTPHLTMLGYTSIGVGIAFIPGIVSKHVKYHGVTFLPISDRPLIRYMYLVAVNRSILNLLTYKLSV